MQIVENWARGDRYALMHEGIILATSNNHGELVSLAAQIEREVVKRRRRFWGTVGGLLGLGLAIWGS